MTSVIAIFDIGKTNKKLFLFDERYALVWEKSESMAETVDDDGDPCEDLTRLTDWVRSSLVEVIRLPGFVVKAINFSTYGASFVYLDADRQPVGYLYNYLKPFPAWLRQRFYNTYGNEATLAVETASPALDSLNSGLMLYRVKHDKPALFRQIRYALHLPQYLSFLFTGQVATDLTSIGCHTMLWNFAESQYHRWVNAEGLTNLLGPIFPSDMVLTVIIDGQSVQVGIGLHDSSAALIPYLASFAEPFALLSTGTWCVSMNPFDVRPLTAEELQYDCLNYVQYRGPSVKASRLFAGYEHEQQTQRLADHFHVSADHYTQLGYDPALIKSVQSRLEPVLSVGSDMVGERMISLHGSLFGARDLSAFGSYAEAYHQLIHDIMARQLISTKLVMPTDVNAVTRLFVDGGFGKNPIYMHLLATAFPDLAVFAASVGQASALGAALAIHHHWNPQPLPTSSIDLRRYFF